ncbi:MAG: nucleotidyl transferase AbiEii/AbiGii toxin family protein [bacterium]|nr:nucleotidyl transferase AbiEii/AbiGii toxin family protein [bacterium]
MSPFEITTQTIERTLEDKVFALCDYYMQGEIERHSRHLYDIYKIVNAIGITEELAKLIPDVRAVCSELSICPFAKEGVCVTDILYEMMENQAYRKDYEEITLGLLFVQETYDTVIQSIKQLADSGIWNSESKFTQP